MKRGTKAWLVALAILSAVAVVIAVALTWDLAGPSYDMKRFPGSCGVGPDLLAAGDVPADFLDGADDREEVDGQDRTWSAIGVVSTPRTSCAATLIGRNTVVTALHCIMADDTNPFRPEFINVAWDVAEGVSPTVAQATEIHVQETVDLPVGVPVFVEDVVILTLNRNVGDHFGHIRIAPRDFPVEPDLEVDLVGYAFEQGGALNEAPTLLRHPGCTIGALAHGGLFASDCDVLPGSSGSPLVYRGEDGPMIVGITTNVMCKPDGGALGAGGITSAELWQSFPQLLGGLATASE